VGQSIGNSAMQAFEFRPAHLHRDIVITDGRICDEIQFDCISLQDRRAAYRFVDEPPSHDISRAMTERRPLNKSWRRMEWEVAIHESRRYRQEGKDAASHDELNNV
jgi:hypothetical protein